MNEPTDHELRALLRDVDPPPADVRERAIHAALAAFDDSQDDRSTVVPLRHRRRDGLLAAAAAVVVIAVGGLVIAQRGDDGGSDDLTTSARTETAMTAAGPGAPTSGASVLDAATGPASASGTVVARTAEPRTVDSRAALSALADEYASGLAPTSREQITGATCVEDGAVVLTPIVYVGTPALAVRLRDGTVVAMDPASECRVLASVAP